MAKSKAQKIIVSIPEELKKLTKEEASGLRDAFKTQLANRLSSDVELASLNITIQNTKPGVQGLALKPASKVRSIKSGKKASKGGGKGSKGSKGRK